MNKTVLIADDSMFMRNYIKQIVVDNNFQVVAEASNGYEAIDKYKQFSPHLVLMDITMPRMNGLDALKEIQKVNPLARVVMCSSLGQKSIIFEALRHGAYDFVVKPYFNNLVSILQSIDEHNSF